MKEMEKWFAWIVGALCGFIAIFKVLGGFVCLVALYRKWSGVSDLWAIDWLDVVFRMEREFGISLTGDDFAGLSRENRLSLTAGQLWEVVAAKINQAGHDVPGDSWGRVVSELAEALNVPRKRISPDARLYAELGMSAEFG
jgi:hypothetical protein